MSQNGSRDSTRGDGTYTRDCYEPETNFTVPILGHDPSFGLFDFIAEPPKLVDARPKRIDGFWKRVLDFMVGVVDCPRTSRPFGGDDPEFREVASQCVDQYRPLSDKQITDFVQHQNGLLLSRLYATKRIVGLVTVL